MNLLNVFFTENKSSSLTAAFEAQMYSLLWMLLFQLTVDGFAIDKMAAEVKVRT